MWLAAPSPWEILSVLSWETLFYFTKGDSIAFLVPLGFKSLQKPQDWMNLGQKGPTSQGVDAKSFSL